MLKCFIVETGYEFLHKCFSCENKCLSKCLLVWTPTCMCFMAL